MESTQAPIDILKQIALENNLELNSEAFAKFMDEQDPLKHCRAKFHIPSARDIQTAEGDVEHDKLPTVEGDCLYFTGNSLGLQPKKAEEYINADLKAWRQRGVLGHFTGEHPWLTIDEVVTPKMTTVVGAEAGEVAVMNSLSANLHFMMVAFYRPTETRHKILIEKGSFPSDWYAAESQIKFHKFDPKESLVMIEPREGEHLLRTEDIISTIKSHDFALVLLPGVQYASGQVLDMPAITSAAHGSGAFVGFDLAHAVGNIPLKLHAWNVDFAVWCSYKYLNSGPGGIGGAFVHSKHAHNKDLPRFAGWWGHDLKTRFGMKDEFCPIPGAFGFRLSNPCSFPILSLLATLEIMDEVGMQAMRTKSEKLTGFLEFLIQHHLAGTATIITPRDSAQRGCQLSLMFKGRETKQLEKQLYMNGVVCDARGEIIRVAPTPLYNTFEDVWHFIQRIKALL